MAKTCNYIFITISYIIICSLCNLGCAPKKSSDQCVDQDLDQVCTYGADQIAGTADDDCDDSDPSIHPNADEVCDNLDNDCDGETDEPDAKDASIWYEDSDGDGFGNLDLPVFACSLPEGYSSDPTDCDDNRGDVRPDTIELTCDNLDNDCDPLTIDRPDFDEDGYDACVDCDDQNILYHPHATELPKDLIDQNCDGADRCQDLNCDGWVDMVVTTYDQSVKGIANSYIYWGGQAGFTLENRAVLPTLWAKDSNVADLNGDGYLDIVISNHSDGNIFHVDSYIYWGSVDGFSIDERTSLPTIGASGNSVTDFNNDGYLDIVFSNTRNDEESFEINSYVYWGSEAGFLPDHKTELPTVGATGVSTSDLNRDGYADIVFSNHQNGTTSRVDSYIYWGSASGFTVENRTALPTQGSYDNCIADLNGDTLPDIVFANSFDDTTSYVDSYIYWGSRNGFLIILRDKLPTIGTQACSIADLDKDGHLDIVFSNANRDQEKDSYIYWGSRLGYETADRTSLPTRISYNNQIADIDEDGYLDIVFTSLPTWSEEESQSVIYWGSSGRFSSRASTPTPFAGTSGLTLAGPGLSLQETGTSINLSVDKILMSQGVDFGLFPEKNLGSVTVPRINGRPTLVRAYLKIERYSDIPMSVTARLHGEFSGEPLPGSPLEAVIESAPLSPSTEIWADSFNFILPDSWSVMGVHFYLEIDPENQYLESDETDNRAPLFGKLSPEFTNHNPLDLMIVPVIQGGLDPDPDAYPEIEKWVSWFYPVPLVNTQIHTPVTYTGDAVAANGTNWTNVLDFVTTIRGAETNRPDLYYYGVIDTGYSFGVTGIAWVPYFPSYTLPVALGTDDIDIAGMTAAHEIGHNHGRKHVPGCNNPSLLDPDYPYPFGRIGVTGWQPGTTDLLEKNHWKDLMSYCDDVWVSDYNYKAFFDWEVAVLEEQSTFYQSSENRVFYLSGSMDNGKITSIRAFDLLNHPETPDQGEHLLELLDAKGNLLSTRRFTVFATDSLSNRQAFIVKVDRTHLSIMGYRIKDPIGRILTDQKSTLAPPRAEITSAGNTYLGTSMITWRKDKDRDLLQMVMVYNQITDRWEVRSLESNQGACEWKNTGSPNTQNRVRLIVSDGILSDILETTF